MKNQALALELNANSFPLRNKRQRSQSWWVSYMRRTQQMQAHVPSSVGDGLGLLGHASPAALEELLPM